MTRFWADPSRWTFSDELKSCTLSLIGLHCGACAWLIENAAKRTPGWENARVKMSDHTIEILFAPKQIALSRIAEILNRLGYQPMPRFADVDESLQRENREHLQRIAVAGFCAANAMWISIALYAADAAQIAAGHYHLLRITGAVLGILSVVFPGRTFFISALASIRTRTPHMDLPVALGLATGTIVGLIHALRGVGDVYFDSVAMLVFLLLIGRWIQFRQQGRAARAVEMMLRLLPQHAKRVTDDGREEMVPLETIQVGDQIRVSAGDAIPIDGEILSGQTTIDRSLLTGESVPVKAAAGQRVAAGTINVASAIDVRAEAVGHSSRIGQVMELVEQAASNKTSVVQFADRVGGYFVCIVTALAFVTFAVWCLESPLLATEHATALLIVACPCALALATPLAIAMFVGRSAKERILIRDGETIQRLAKPGTIWFDKTGTLTEGNLRIMQIAGDERALADAAAVERHVVHPIATCIVAAAERHGVSDETTWRFDRIASGRCGRTERTTSDPRR